MASPVVEVDSETIADIRSALGSMRSDDYSLWITNAMRLRALGERGRALWLEWSQMSAKYKPEDARRWETFVPDHTGFQAIFAQAQRDFGWVNPRSKIASLSATRRPVAIKNAAELLRTEFQPLSWTLKGILPEGVTILSGDPKIGKSWLVYQACVAVAAGRPLWPGRPPEETGEVLLLALEENERRLKRRLDKLQEHFWAASGKSAPDGVTFSVPELSNLHYVTEWERAEAGVQRLSAWMHAHPNTRLVVIDTISAFRKTDPGRKSAYAIDYEVGELFKPLARQFHAAIVLVMHNRKMSAEDPFQLVSGTQGMTGGVDNVIVMRRERGRMDAALFVDGRDIEEQQELALTFSDGFWHSSGSVAEAKRSQSREEILGAIKFLGLDAKSKRIAEQLESKEYGAVRRMLTKMVHAGELKNEGGIYMPTHTYGNNGSHG
jgi:hypothetical protein